MKREEMKPQESVGCRKNKLSRILPDSITDIAILFGLAAIVTCILFGLESEDNE